MHINSAGAYFSLGSILELSSSRRRACSVVFVGLHKFPSTSTSLGRSLYIRARPPAGLCTLVRYNPERVQGRRIYATRRRYVHGMHLCTMLWGEGRGRNCDGTGHDGARMHGRVLADRRCPAWDDALPHTLL